MTSQECGVFLLERKSAESTRETLRVATCHTRQTEGRPSSRLIMGRLNENHYSVWILMVAMFGLGLCTPPSSPCCSSIQVDKVTNTVVAPLGHPCGPRLPSVDLDAPVNPANKNIGGQEANGPRGHGVDRAGECAVTEKQQTADEAVNVEPRPVIPNRVDKYPGPRRPSHEK